MVLHKTYISLLVVMGIACSLIAQESARKCWIKSMVGDVKVQRDKSPKWLEARPNTVLKENDAVRTFTESEAVLETSEGSVINIGENSTLELSAFAQSSDQATTTGVTIHTGNLMANVKKLVNAKSKFEFETPTAVAAIRGTRLGIDVAESKTDIKVYEGKVYVVPKGARKGAQLEANQMTTVVKGQQDVQIQNFSGKKEEPVQEPAGQKPVDSIRTATAKPPSPDSTKKDTVQKAKENVVLDLKVFTPENGLVLKPGDNVSVSGKVSPVKAIVKINGLEVPVSSTGEFKRAEKAPVDAGRYEVVVEASFKDFSKVEKRTLTVKKDEKDTVTKSEVDLKVFSPENGLVVKPGENIIISGKVLPQKSTVKINGQETGVSSTGEFKKMEKAPADQGRYEIEIEAIYKDAVKKEKRYYLVKAIPVELNLQILEPANGQVIARPQIRVSGLVTPGAEVTVSGMAVPVAPNGSFTKELPIPDEEGEIAVEISATLNQKTKTETRTVVYRPVSEEILFTILTPVDRQVVCTEKVPIKGTVQPASIATITVNGSDCIVRNGIFNELITIPGEEGEHQIVFEATNKDKSKSVRRVVKYDPSGRMCNSDIPVIQPTSLPLTVKTTFVSFTVYDKTPFDEITFYTAVDGVKSSETGPPGSRFNLTIEEGIHAYETYAQDRAGNISQKVSGNISCLLKEPMIQLVAPDKEYTMIHIPPPAPQSNFRPEYTVTFVVRNLPDDNPKLLREVRVTNRTNGDSKSQKIFLITNEFDFDMKLVRGRNSIFIEVRDINEQLYTKECILEVR